MGDGVENTPIGADGLLFHPIVELAEHVRQLVTLILPNELGNRNLAVHQETPQTARTPVIGISENDAIEISVRSCTVVVTLHSLGEVEVGCLEVRDEVQHFPPVELDLVQVLV